MRFKLLIPALSILVTCLWGAGAPVQAQTNITSFAGYVLPTAAPSSVTDGAGWTVNAYPQPVAPNGSGHGVSAFPARNGQATPLVGNFIYEILRPAGDGGAIKPCLEWVMIHRAYSSIDVQHFLALWDGCHSFGPSWPLGGWIYVQQANTLPTKLIDGTLRYAVIVRHQVSNNTWLGITMDPNTNAQTTRGTSSGTRIDGVYLGYVGTKFSYSTCQATPSWSSTGVAKYDLSYDLGSPIWGAVALKPEYRTDFKSGACFFGGGWNLTAPAGIRQQVKVNTPA